MKTRKSENKTKTMKTKIGNKKFRREIKQKKNHFLTTLYILSIFCELFTVGSNALKVHKVQGMKLHYDRQREIRKKKKKKNKNNLKMVISFYFGHFNQNRLPAKLKHLTEMENVCVLRAESITIKKKNRRRKKHQLRDEHF